MSGNFSVIRQLGNAMVVENNAAKNLSKQMAAVGAASRDLANMNNEEYSRSSVIMHAGDGCTGSIVMDISHVRDAILDEIIVTGVNMPRSLEETLYRGASDMQTVLGETIDRRGAAATLEQSDESIANSTSLGSRVASFFTSAMRLSNNTKEMHDRSLFLNEATTLVDRFHLFADNQNRFKDGIQARIHADLDKVGVVLGKVADANREVKRAELGGGSVATNARDLREASLRELGELISFTIERGTEGFHDIRLVTQDSTGAPVTLLNRARVLEQVEYDTTTGHFSCTGTANPLSFTGGSLRGHQKVLQEFFPDLQARMDALANQIHTSVNGIYGNWTALDGSTCSFFSGPATAEGIAVDPHLTPSNLKTTNTGYTGANEVIKAIGELAGRSFSTQDGDAIDGTFKGTLSGIISYVGNTVVASKNRLEAIKNTEKVLLDKDFSKRGVSLPETIANIQKAAQAFEYTKFIIHTLHKMDVTEAFR